MYYRCTFGMRGGPHESPLATLDRMARIIAEQLGDGEPKPWVERGSTGQEGFWELTTERKTLDRSGNRVRLEIRARADGSGCAGQVTTRYMIEAGENRWERPTFPPRTLRRVLKEIECYRGQQLLTWEARRVDGKSAPEFIELCLQDARRDIPVLMVTGRSQQLADQRADHIQARCAGTAIVASIYQDATRTVRDAVGKATYNGAMRLVSPGGARDSQYYDAEPDVRLLIERCLAMTPQQDFDEAYEAAKDRVEPEQGRALQEARAEIEELKAAQLSAGSSARVQQLEYDGASRVTALNHAINQARDPLRNYVARALDKRFGARAAEEVLTLRTKRGMKLEAVRRDVPGAIDINDIPHLMAKAMPKGGESLLARLREMKQIRNLAAHPPRGGITATECADKIEVVSDVMRAIGEHRIAERIAPKAKVRTSPSKRTRGQRRKRRGAGAQQ